MYTFQALQILVFLIPGFISATLLNIFLVKREKSDLGKIVEALILSLLIYTIYSLSINISPISLITLNESNTRISYDSIAFLWLLLYSIIIPIILSIFVTNDLHMKIARLFRISRRTARSSVWFDVFSDQRKHVIITFSNERRIYGWPMYYSDDPDNQYVYLYKPAWIEYDEKSKESKYIDLDVDGILIIPTTEQKIELIEFLKE